MTNTLTLNVKQIIFNNALFDNDIYRVDLQDFVS